MEAKDRRSLGIPGRMWTFTALWILLVVGAYLLTCATVLEEKTPDVVFSAVFLAFLALPLALLLHVLFTVWWIIRGFPEIGDLGPRTVGLLCGVFTVSEITGVGYLYVWLVSNLNFA